MEITKTMDGNAAMLSLSGVLDKYSAPALSEALDGLGEVGDLVLDLERLEDITTTGLGQIVKADKMMRGKGTFTIIRAPFAVMDKLRMSGLTERITVLS